MALVALLLTIVNIVVTVVNFKKSAGHVVVQMNAALLNPGRSFAADDKGKWGLDPVDWDSKGVELARVVIENPGRTAATITKLNIRVEGLRDADCAVGVAPLELQPLGKAPGSTTAVTELPYRLEPYDQVIYLLDFWAVANYAFMKEPEVRQINIWASVKVAGQPQPYGSQKCGYWTIKREWVSFIAPYTQCSAHSLILSELMNIFDDPAQNMYLGNLASMIEEQISPESSSREITSVLQKILGPGGEFRGEILGSYNVWGLTKFGFDLKSRLDVIGGNVVWARSVDATK